MSKPSTRYIVTSENRFGVVKPTVSSPRSWAFKVAERRRSNGHVNVRVWRYPEMTKVAEPVPEYLLHWVQSPDHPAWRSGNFGTDFAPCAGDEVFVRTDTGDFRKLTACEVEALIRDAKEDA